MSKVTREAWHCDVCGWEWLPDSSKVPERCPNRQCRKRNWNDPPIGKEAMTALMDDAKKFIVTMAVKNLIEVTPQELETHRRAMQNEPLGSGNTCKLCGCLKGLHQKGCKAPIGCKPK